MNVDDAPSASVSTFEGDQGKRFYFTFGTAAAAPESSLKAKKLCSSIIMKIHLGREKAVAEVKKKTSENNIKISTRTAR